MYGKILPIIIIGLIVPMPSRGATVSLYATNSQKIDVGYFPEGMSLTIIATDAVAIATGFLIYPDGALAAPIPPPYDSALSYANPGATNYPTVDGGDGTNHFIGGGFNYVPDSVAPPEYRYPVAGKLTTDTTDPQAIRFGTAIATFSDTPSRSGWFVVGYGTNVPVPAGGAHLYLLVNESFYPDNDRSFGVTVSPELVRLEFVPPFTNGQFGLRVTGAPGTNYTIQFATDLVSTNTSWISLTSNSTNGMFEFVDNQATNRARFYRAVSQ